MTSHRERWDAYFVRDAHGQPTDVLANKLGITDQLELLKAERQHSNLATARILHGDIPIPKTFDLAHLKAIHKALFNEVYEWAGHPHTVGISKGVSDFALPGLEVEQAVRMAQRIIADTPWRATSPEVFATCMDQVFAWINHAHPFREGNGRTTRLFLMDVAALGQRELQFQRIHPNVWNQRSELTSPDRGSVIPVPDAMIDVFRLIARTTPHRDQQHQQPLIDQLRARAAQQTPTTNRHDRQHTTHHDQDLER